MKAKPMHTPGPWEFVLVDDGDSCCVQFVIRMGTHLGGQNGWETQHRLEYEVSAKDDAPAQFAEAEANARLIAAAPDLLAALKDCCAALGGIKRNPDAIPQSALLAIAKAEGR